MLQPTFLGITRMHSTGLDTGREREPDLVDGLQALAFAVKSLQLYPPTSPVVRDAIRRSFAALAPLLKDGYLTLEVTPRFLRHGDQEIGPGQILVTQLSRKLHGHGVGRLHFDAGLQEKSLQRLAELVATVGRHLDERGGLAVVFNDERPRGVHAEFLELDRLFDDQADGAVEDIWEALLEGFRITADTEEVDWDALANNLNRLQDFVAWMADNVDSIAERTGYENVDVFRFVLDHMGSIAAALGTESVNFLVLAVRRIFDRIEPETLVELLAEPLEVEVPRQDKPAGMSLSGFLAGEDPRSAADAPRRTIDVTQLIACGLEPEQTEELILHTMLNNEKSSTRLYGLFSRLMEGREERVSVARRVRSFLEQYVAQEGGSDFLEVWPRLSDVLEGEAPERFVSPTYQATLQRLLADDTLTGAWPIERIEPRFNEMRPGFIAQRKTLVLSDVLEIETDDKKYAHLAGEIEKSLRELVIHDQYALALRMLKTLRQHAAEDSGKPTSQRRSAAEIVDRFYDPGALRDLLRDSLGKLRQDTDPIAEIIELGGEEIVPALLDALAEESNRRVRQRLLKILTGRGAAVTDVIAQRLGDERWYVVRNLVLLLGDSGDPAQLDRLAPLLHHDDARVRREVVEAAIKLGGDRVSTLLLEATDDDDPDVRATAVHGLGFHRSEAGVAKLRRLLRLPNLRGQNTQPIRVAAIALGRLGDHAAEKELTRLGKDPWLYAELRRPAQQAAAWALDAIGGRRVGAPPEPGFLRGVRPPWKTR